MSPILEVEDLYKRFPISGSRRYVQAINGVTFSVGAGETLGLVGESGSGKTTVGRCIVGLTELSAGRIRFKGEDISKPRARWPRHLLGKIQLVFQEPGESLDPRMRIGRSIEEPLLALKVPPSERRALVAEAIERVGLSREMLELYPAELSAGQQQRVAIARAMITSPELVVLDEPTSALDPTARAEIIALLMKIQAELGTAYLFISHDLSTVRFISHRVAVVYLGMIVEQGDVGEVFAAPRHPYSAGLLSAVLLPHPHFSLESSIRLEGEIPSPINLPQGCFLASRCPLAIARCRQEMPPPDNLGGGHMVHCFRHRDVASMDHASDTFAEFQREAERILAGQKTAGPVCNLGGTSNG
ncbi:MAG: ABC transporter ATP-binding protein [Acidobacteriia bacterium]|nr:ABC transporter ATP-binding protein [Methyloceanibacter sp.]MBX5471890.1 ABC transporter ATP-binding protein [Acetobacteraceae bacterium]MCL6491120.1 ABC transporter ATP-binding protein [Terriglobia bacterium]